MAQLGKVGRNDPCPCGSGKKYKKCCMVKNEEPRAADTSPLVSDDPAVKHLPPARAAEVENAFRRALNHLGREEYDQAARAFRSVLRLDPQHYKALTGLGRCLMAAGMREEAHECFRKALKIKPDYAQARLNLEL